MSLGRKLFLLIGGLLCLLLGGQWLLYRSLARTVSEDVRTVAFRVGEGIVSGFTFETEVHPRSPAPPAEAGPGAAPEGEGLPEKGNGDPAALPARGHGRVIVLRTDPAGAATSPAAAAAGAVANGFDATTTEETETIAEDGSVKRVLRREWTLRDPADAAKAQETFAKRIPRQQPLEVALGGDDMDDVLFLRGPELEKSIPIPRKIVEDSFARFGSQLLVGNLVLLALGLLFAAWLAHRMTRPLAALAEAAERVGGGELGITVPASGATHDEVGRAVASFNRMSGRLVELDRENRRLLEAEQLSELGDVARGLAHSLRNPLNALGLSIDRLGERAAAGASGAPGAMPSAELVEGSRRQIRRIDGALRSFLALASGGSAPAERLDLATLCREVALEALQDGAAAGVATKIDVEGAPGEGLAIEGVAAELKAILQALVVNAVEASAAAAAPAVRIRLRPRQGGGGVVEVLDDGPGLPPAVRERLFEPHVTTKPHGSGMGLFLAHRLATTRYGGALRLEARPEGGTAAIVELGPRSGAGA